MTAEKITMFEDDVSDDLKAGLTRLKDNIIIAMVNRAGGRLTFPVEEIDNAAGVLTLTVGQVDGKPAFILEATAQQ